MTLEELRSRGLAGKRTDKGELSQVHEQVNATFPSWAANKKDILITGNC